MRSRNRVSKKRKTSANFKFDNGCDGCAGRRWGEIHKLFKQPTVFCPSVQLFIFPLGMGMAHGHQSVPSISAVSHFARCLARSRIKEWKFRIKATFSSCRSFNLQCCLLSRAIFFPIPASMSTQHFWFHCFWRLRFSVVFDPAVVVIVVHRSSVLIICHKLNLLFQNK